MSGEVVKVLSELERIWGIRVHRYEIKNISTPRTVQKAMERQMTAERDRRAIIAKSEGVRDSNINDAEGRKAEMVNISEAEMQRQINEAEGWAQEIESIAEATAKSIEEIADAVSQPKGIDAMQLQLKQKYLNVFEGLGRKDNSIILPKDITNYDALMEGLSLDNLDGKNPPK
jgi:regulator of protease activity HflC (stomatin/prohibitin superfamily)